MLNLLQPNASKILVIRRDNIGDLVCTTPLFAQLRLTFPNADIGVLVNSYNADVLRGNPNINQIYVYQKHKHARHLIDQYKAIWTKLQLLKKLRRWAPDIVLLAKSGYDRQGLSLSWQIGAKISVGFSLGTERYQPDIPLSVPEFNKHHEVECLSLLLTPLGVREPPGPLQIFPEKNWVSKLESCFSTPKRLRIAVHLSAREPERRWGENNYQDLIRQILLRYPDAEIALFWAPGKGTDPQHPGDDESAKSIIRDLMDVRLIPMPTSTLAQLVAGLSLCDLFIGADGGAMHLAAAVGCKILALFENREDKFRHWYPWHCPHLIITGAGSSISTIPVSRVIDSVALLVSAATDR